ncbi:MAG: hypothetical protein UV82_C0009G0063 [Candidatus Magasanikbacteria bacterium GW2011_GWD2_43_18]|uniref:Uncharacterized protein n=1 Tax=Candidatus Magasanikbacteria bacterium GW2011_GWE2_42_7 TaxID=1619052 RepID=A0A0G1EAH4_9BACT|nr:MAG: hypothetical protein UV18_C0004G0147 [Candidatus Magasanikbacteria bacterium GW2011_GWC2_42_27]KKS71583.1 MAG: hypothetical protein UV42_C0024G0005 [Candidatus Magasanikbacteria bacterium GW2011_GWE2_42_7]KKT04324.1 MAG: hypothetical protein UV82_C0009G0063 [Candidatus Magasanikbacteria bacterium GW2011_GWD2_43_18]KKT25321.1 MAG: hypothetical protein UW10_C0009G0003 [Candidatus Magasanikbacteria bacterium GW2011_GWA2_43_9]HBB38333.1 hypothetical protein [Candidatus Magasanikbacteria bac
MQIQNSKKLAQFIAGMFGGTTFGIAGFLAMTGYGGNYGCWPLIDAIFHMQGYESCGSFGAISGILLGVLVGISVLSSIPISHYAKITKYLFLGTFILPFLYGVFMFWPPFEDGDMIIVAPIILVFMILSSIPSAIMTGILQAISILRKK